MGRVGRACDLLERRGSAPLGLRKYPFSFFSQLEGSFSQFEDRIAPGLRLNGPKLVLYDRCVSSYTSILGDIWLWVGVPWAERSGLESAFSSLSIYMCSQVTKWLINWLTDKPAGWKRGRGFGRLLWYMLFLALLLCPKWHMNPDRIFVY